MRTALADQGAPVAFEISQEGLRGVYVDARATLGHYVIDKVFAFDDAKAAWAYYAGRKSFGKVVVTH